MHSKRIIKDNRGTALLVALLVMGVLISVSLALSNLIVREIKTVKEVLDSGRAYYAAESGIETSLYKVKNSLPGWSTTSKDGESIVYKTLKLDEEIKTFAEYKVNNRCNAYPCFDDNFDTDSVTDVKEFYDVLELNESIMVPLFVVDGNGNEVPVEDFTVEFFVDFNIEDHFDENIKKQFGSKGLGALDVLRWKMFGVREDGAGGTEAVSDFTAVSSGSNALNPSWFGTVSCSENSYDQDNRYAQISCPGYQIRGQEIDYDAELESALILGGCLNTQAREHYVYGADAKVGAGDIRECYPIEDFLFGGADPHRLNYLTLTNLINPAIFKKEFNEQKMSKIYFRIEFFGAEGKSSTVREFADITSNGYSGDSKKSINVKIQKGSFMPVFNFSLYSTYKGEEGFEHYYGKEEEQTL